MTHSTFTFLRTDKLSPRLRHAMPTSIREAHIVSVEGGYQLQAKLRGSSAQWVLTSPGGLVDTTNDISMLRRFAKVVLGRANTPVL